MARIVIPDVPHHVTQRGNRREDVFFEDADRRRYLLLMLDYSLPVPVTHNLSHLISSVWAWGRV